MSRTEQLPGAAVGIERPESPLTPAELRRYARQLILPGFGARAQQRLRAARVLCIGAGGLGSPAMLYLAAAGVGTIGIIDDDVVEESNLHRQVVHGAPAIGTAKTSSAASRLRELNPLTTVVEHAERLTVDNAIDLFSGYDLVLDGADSFATRYLVSDAAELTARTVVWASLLRYGGQLAVFAPGRGPGLRDLFPEPPEPGEVPSCAEGGVLPSLCGIIGTSMANEAIKVITGIGEPLLGRVALFDALRFEWNVLRVAADPDAAGREALETDYEEFCGVPSAAADAVSKNASTAEAHDRSGVSAGQDAGSVDAAELAARLDSGRAPLLIDVREPHETALARIPGARLIPLGTLPERLPDLPADAEIVVYCQAGVRSEKARALLLASGHEATRHLRGGIAAWLAQELPIEQ